MLLAGIQDRSDHGVTVLPRPDEFESRLARHAVPKCSHGLPSDAEAGAVEELHRRRLFPEHFADDVHRTGALHLVAVDDRVADSTVGRVVAPDLDVVAARLRVVLEPVDARRDADRLELVLLVPEEDVVPDQLAIRVDRDVLLGRVHRKVLDAVYGRVADELERIGTLDVEVSHVVGLIEKDRTATPRQLLVSPVGELRRDGRTHDRGTLRLPEQGVGAAGFGNRLVEIGGHVIPP